MATVCLEGVANSHGHDLLHAPPGKDPIIDNEDSGD
jgi:hypothetical protein